MKHYLDSSVLVSFLLEGDDSILQLSGEPAVGSSRLLWVEVARVLERAMRANRLSEDDAVAGRREFERLSAGIARLKLNEAVLRRAAGPYPTVIRTLDAIHLATAEAWLEREDPDTLCVWTLDRQMNLCAAALGFKTPLFPG